MKAVKKKIKLNDKVEVICGKDRGRVGKVIRISRDNDRVLVEKINMIKRHTKPNMVNQQGGIIEREAPIHISNLMLVCPKCAKAVKVGRKALDDGSRVRVCKKCGESVEATA